MALRPNGGTDCTRAKNRALPYVTKCLSDATGVLVAASDYLKTLPNMISKWMPRRLASLGTDGFGGARAALLCAILRGSTPASSRCYEMIGLVLGG